VKSSIKGSMTTRVVAVRKGTSFKEMTARFSVTDSAGPGPRF
jgi:hypothetical protein